MTSNLETWRDLCFPTRATYTFPNVVNVEVFRGACPCKCRHCPVGTAEPATRKEHFGQQSINLGLYDKITQQVGQHPWATVRIHSVGDPILWKELPEALQVGTKNNTRSWIFTSAVTDDTTLLDAMCEHAAIVEVSINSINSADYRDTKGIDAFQLVRKNLCHMHDRVVAGSSTRLIVSRVQSSDQVADEEFVRYWKASGLVHDAFVRSFHTYNDSIPEQIPTQAGLTHQPCLVHWARFNIDVSGRAVVCFNDLFKRSLDPALILGDVNQQPVAKIWHGPKLTALRKAELTGDYADLSYADRLPCKDCSSCQPLFGQRQTSEHQLRQLVEQTSPVAGKPIDVAPERAT